jgi:hypothetical protein
MRRKHNLKLRYGITPGDFWMMKERQGGRCAICLQAPGRLHVDHCHASGRVRGLLCGPCNRKLATIEDVKFREAALMYLRRSM